MATNQKQTMLLAPFHSYLSYLSALSWYILFGFLHELSHVVIAACTLPCSLSLQQSMMTVWKSVDWMDLILHRRFRYSLDVNVGTSINASNDVNVDVDSLSFMTQSEVEHHYFIIRHFGWISSVFIALLVYVLFNRFNCNRVDSNGNGNRSLHHADTSNEANYVGGKVGIWFERCQLAACLTAMDAIWTDLLQMNPLFYSQDHSNTTMDMDLNVDSSSSFPLTLSLSTVTFFCGNFGVILLHSAWLDDKSGRKSSIGILQKMIEVTMMRGAQSGGIVTFMNHKKSDGDGDSDSKIQMKSIRSRVVKSKRGDLSKILTTKLQKDALSPFQLGFCSSKVSHTDDINTSRKNVSPATGSEVDCLNGSINGYAHNSNAHRKDVRFFAGHTRFATSSKANLDGTHPHQWTPPKRRRIYNFYKSSPNHSNSMNSTQQQRNNNNNINNSLGLSNPRVRRHFVPDSPIGIMMENYITHNGDFEYYELNGTHYEIDTIQKWLTIATGAKMPTVVDSCAIAGMVDLIRCKGSFALSCRYVTCLGLSSSRITTMEEWLPTDAHYYKMGLLFEEALQDLQKMYPFGLNDIGEDDEHRETLARSVTEKIGLYKNRNVANAFSHHTSNAEGGVSTYHFAKATINAFFDNDLLNTVKIFMKNASGSFGLCVMSSLDAHGQFCLAARGQSTSIALYPQKKMICYGSEQAAVKAGMLFKFPGSSVDEIGQTHLDIDDDVQRIDLDDVGGEICLVDWSGDDNPVSRPNRDIQPHLVMHNTVSLYLVQESDNLPQPKYLYQRMTKLTNNRLILPLKEDCSDPILQDLQDIPKICREIQDNWRNVDSNSTFSLNRLTAVNLGRCIKHKMEGYASGSIHRNHNKVDILLTGCEVSLWLAEQFGSDLQKAFPNLRIHVTSSNKLLGLFGQEDINIPTIGFPYNETSLQFDDAIMIIVSHSGGTFGPLSCSSLFQSMTKNIFVVTSEWDTQIGKQLRSMNQHSVDNELLYNSYIFSTGVGIRPAEPCSISVVATHQLLTNIFQYISIVILSNKKYHQLSGAVVTEKDLQILEKCNRDNVFALEDIVGNDFGGTTFKSELEKSLRHSGDIWAEHILENAKAYIITFVYIFATVISGYPLISGIAYLIGLQSSSKFTYLTRFFDAMIYFFMPQINIIILRLIQRRPLRHRMVGRTVVIGDIPWVAQAAEAFLSKIFACSYSIAGVNVYSANPSDHLVHRMTHRVVRGTLLICGRPDGRLSALTASENAVCLSINQASSIQSIGSTCETVTIGHNQFKLPLSKRAIFLRRHRPLFLCEYLLAERDGDGVKAKDATPISSSSMHGRSLDEYLPRGTNQRQRVSVNRGEDSLLESLGNLNSGDSNKRQRKPRPKSPIRRTSAALLGQYKSIEKDTIHKIQHNQFMDRSEKLSLRKVVNTVIQEKKWLTEGRRLFESLNVDNDGKLKMNEFIALSCDKTEEELSSLFLRFDNDSRGYLHFDDFFNLMSMGKIVVEHVLEPCIRDTRGLIQVGVNRERFFGESLIEMNNVSEIGPDSSNSNTSISIGAMKSQNFSQELYESRIASLQRFVAMTVMFHQMGFRVQDFFRNISFGFLGYRMDRSHSIMRIATTASPISGAEIRDRAKIMFYMKEVHHSINTISSAWLDYKERQLKRD